MSDLVLESMLQMCEMGVPELTLEPLRIYWSLVGLGPMAFWTCGDRVCGAHATIEMMCIRTAKIDMS